MRIAAGQRRAASLLAPRTRPHGSRLLRIHNTTRAFSSTPPSIPPLNARKLFERVMERRSVYKAYKDAGVFSPNLWILNRWLLFTTLQMPRKTVVDMPEFLEGAKRAVASVIQVTSSRDFTEFVVAVDESPSGTSIESENARLLQQWCLPNCYELMVGNVRNSWARQRKYEVEDITVDSICLTMARYDRVSQAELRDDPGLAQQIRAQRKWSADATIERLQLNVGFATTERTRQTFLDQKKVRVVDCKWYYQAALLSDVTNMDVIDWRVAAVVAERGLGQTLLSEEALDETPNKEETNTTPSS